MLRFQSTFPRGERRFLRGGSRLVSYFNPRSLVGNDVLRRAACPLLFYFNPRSLVGNDGNQNIRRNQNGNFNPRSLVGNDLVLHNVYMRCIISIHVPSWGTTPCLSNRHHSSIISIHVPSWGTTAEQINYFWNFKDFNPRSLVGNDEQSKKAQLAMVISIHVPSWGTTRHLRTEPRRSSISIHVPSWGTTANFHKYSLFFYAINIIFLLFIIPSLFSLVLFMLLF